MNAPSIRRRLALLVLASIAPAALLALGLLGQEYLRDREAIERNSIATARAMVHAIDRELVSIRLAAEVLATSQRAQRGELAAFYAQAQEVVGRGIGTNVVLSDATGRQVMNTLRPPGEPLPMHGDLERLRTVFATGRPAISDLYIGGVLRRPVMSVEVPVFRDGKVVYGLSIGVLPERFRVLLEEQKLPEGWIGAVYDRSGTVVARTREHEHRVGTKGAPRLLRRMAETPEDALEAVTEEGIPVVAAFSRSPVTGWTVVLGIPRASLVAPLWRRSLAAASAAAAILALGFALAWGIGGSIARSIRSLVEPAARLGRREEIVVPPLGLKEADEVGEALARASRMIVSAEHRAHHDALTGLANRSLLGELAAEHVALCKREGTRLSLLFIDLDGFKRVNDAHGHGTGDRLLCAVAERLKSAVRGSDVVARLGGDEFAVLLVRADVETAAEVAGKLVDSLSTPYAVPPHTLEISASIGVAGYPESGASAEELLKRADEAMYKVKFAGKRGHAVS